MWQGGASVLSLLLLSCTAGTPDMGNHPQLSSSILELREMLPLFQTGFSLENAAVVCTIPESISVTDSSTIDKVETSFEWQVISFISEIRLMHSLVTSIYLYAHGSRTLTTELSERVKNTRQTEKQVWRQHQGMDKPGVRQVPGGSRERRKIEETCEVICGGPTTPAAKG